MIPAPVDILKQEHRVIERVLRALDGLCRELEKGTAVSPESLPPFIDFMRTFADRRHHGKEEVHLFPAMELRGVPREGGPIGVMLHEHVIGRGLVSEMDRSAHAYKEGNPQGVSQFVEAARQFIGMLTQHIYKEDNILFRMAENLLDDEATSALARAFETADAELGRDQYEQYARLADSLEQTWAGNRENP